MADKDILKIFRKPIKTLLFVLLFLFIALIVIIKANIASVGLASKDIIQNIIASILVVIVAFILVDANILEYQEKVRAGRQKQGIKRLRRSLDWFYIWLRYVCLLVEKIKSTGEPKALGENYTLDGLKQYFSEINSKLKSELPFVENDERYKGDLDWNKFFAHNCFLVFGYL